MQNTRKISTIGGYPFGMELPGRGRNDENYRYGFNGKEKDSEGLGGSGSTYDYGFRIYNPNIARFLSVDPLTKDYSELTPYQFASNRPIDGIDLDGLEYYSVHITKIEGQEPVIEIVDHTKTKQGYGPLGPGVDYIWTNSNKMLEVHRFEKNIYGVYQGGNNPKKYWEAPNEEGEYSDWYGLSPIDETDANAMQHDLDYDKVNAAGWQAVVFAKRTVDPDNAYIDRANKTIEKYKSGENDNITGVPVTEAAKDAARSGKRAFIAASIKNIGNVIDKIKEVPFKIEQSVKEMVNPANYGY